MQIHSSIILSLDWKYKSSHPKKYVLRNISEDIKTRSSFKELMNTLALICKIEPKEVEEALVDENWIEAVQK